LGVARTNTSFGVSPEAFLQLLQHYARLCAVIRALWIAC
jgi:hypothetical protein